MDKDYDTLLYDTLKALILEQVMVEFWLEQGVIDEVS